MKDADSYNPEETARRRDAIVKRMIATPPTKHAPLKAKVKPSRGKRATAKPKKRA
jgi:hypothetical protein